MLHNIYFYYPASLLSGQHSTRRAVTEATAIVVVEVEHSRISTRSIVAPAKEPRLAKVREAHVI